MSSERRFVQRMDEGCHGENLEWKLRVTEIEQGLSDETKVDWVQRLVVDRKKRREK